MKPNIACCGLARVGKDTVCDYLVGEYGYKKLSFGDIIKKYCDEYCLDKWNISAFTQIDAEKNMIRDHLITWGDDHYDMICNEYFTAVDACNVEGIPVCNARILRLKEADLWYKRGGDIWCVERPGVWAAEPKEAVALFTLTKEYPDMPIINNSFSVDSLDVSIDYLMSKYDAS